MLIDTPKTIALLLGNLRRSDSEEFQLVRIWSINECVKLDLVEKIAEHFEKVIRYRINSLVQSIYPGKKPNFSKIESDIYRTSLRSFELYVGSKDFENKMSEIMKNSEDIVTIDIPEGMLLEYITNGSEYGDVSDIYRMGINRQLKDLGLKKDSLAISKMLLDRSRENLRGKIGDEMVDQIEKSIKETMFFLKSKYN